MRNQKNISKIRTMFFIFFVLSISFNLFGQKSIDIKTLLKEKYKDQNISTRDRSKPETWREVDDIALVCINHLLSTPDDNEDENRNNIGNFVLEWSEGAKYNLPSMNKYGQELMQIEFSLWFYYMISMNKYYIENKDLKLDEPEITLNAIIVMLDYISKDSNKTESSSLNYSSVQESKLIRELLEAKSKNALKEYLKF